MVYFGSRTDISGSKGDTVKQVRAYYKTNNFGFSNVPSSAPSDNSTAVNTWTFNSLIEPDSATKYIYSSVGTGTISGADSTDIDYGNWTTPELWKAYVGSNIPAHAAVTFAKLFTGSNGTVEQGLKYDTNGKVYINASLIKTGLLSVGDDGELLSAGWNGTTPTVELAGWTATPQMLCYNNLQPGATDSVCLIPKGGGTLTKPIGGKAATNWVITAGSAFGVTKEGKLYCNGGVLQSAEFITKKVESLAGEEEIVEKGLQIDFDKAIIRMKNIYLSNALCELGGWTINAYGLANSNIFLYSSGEVKIASLQMTSALSGEATGNGVSLVYSKSDWELHALFQAIIADIMEMWPVVMTDMSETSSTDLIWAGSELYKYFN